MEGGMQNERPKQPQISAEEWPIYTKMWFQIGNIKTKGYLSLFTA